LALRGDGRRLIADDTERAIGEEKLHDDAEDVTCARCLLAVVVVGEDDLALADNPANQVAVLAFAQDAVALAGSEQEAQVALVQRQRRAHLTPGAPGEL